MMDQFLVGVDLGGTNIKVSAYTFEDWTPVYERRVPTEAQGG